MIKVIPVYEVTMDLRGKKTHDMNALFEDLTRFDKAVYVIDSGILPYKDPYNMGSSIASAMKKRNLIVGFRVIKGEKNKIALFKA